MESKVLSNDVGLAIPGFVFILAALTALAPLATDAYLPAMPTMALELGRTITDVELSISFFLAGFSIGQLVGGPFSDHFGRRTGIFLGLSLFILGSLAITFTSSIEWLWGFRVVQALGGGITVVNTPAIVRDLHSGRESARTLSRMAMILMMAPLLAPVLGSFVLQTFNWQMIFILLLIYGCLLGAVIYRALPETRKLQSSRPNAIRRYWMVMRNRHALGYLFSACFGYGSLFAFITGSPSAYMGYFGLSESTYPLAFGANVFALLLLNKINIRLLANHAPRTLLLAGQLIQIVTGALLFGYAYYGGELQILVFVPLVMLFFGCHGLVSANSMAGMTDLFPTNSATATALMGACGFAFGALSGSLVGLLYDGTPLPMTLVMFACALLAPTIRLLLQMGPQPQTAQ
ncbi:Bcr/CflA family drug resistance efflux transporter [Marinobacterium zhoushanense]|uniref:Bcr/CflA family efflux transporter n=1 Tax=Marinobacterium zhoushanense TaxID=1679163 RepID=A0ABQ1JX82_9GAMM|nr:multidrug effflux MFS transporter [Marinobacterium zhoushanense]GGB81112.1 Bcr/CflA family drug resistance efflux transporter [Marinobacterium zhoushanense]